MRRHWQKHPLLVRQAMPGVRPPLSRAALFDLAASSAIESRLVVHDAQGWQLRHGPFARRSLPPLRQPRWTLLVQGLDLHVQAAHDLLRSFGFIPHARLDDLMLSFATDGGGVGAHLDSYDVFLIQVQGRRCWRVGRARDTRLVEGMPLKILANFIPEHEWLLEPGDMLYLPPNWAHEGVAQGECMTASVGFRADTPGDLVREMLLRLADAVPETDGRSRFSDAAQPATAAPGAIPPRLQAYALRAMRRAIADDTALHTALGEWLSEPKDSVWFDIAAQPADLSGGVVLDRRTRMLYDERCVYVNGESFRAAGRDAASMRRLADQRRLGARELARLSAQARRLLDTWADDGWLHPAPREHT